METKTIDNIEMNKVYNMDCIEGMKLLPDNSVDLIITSPPYNQGLTTQDTSQTLYADNLPDEEYYKLILGVFREAKRVLKDTGSFVYNYKSDIKNNIVRPAFRHLERANSEAHFLLVGEIVWKYAGNFDSARTRFPIDYEMFYHMAKTNKFKFSDLGEKLSSLWRFNHVMYGTKEKKEAGNHPCPYPVDIIRKFIRHLTVEGDIVLDPFMGSGTTAVACRILDRHFIGFEISKEYCDIANNRLKKYMEQTNLTEVLNDGN